MTASCTKGLDTGFVALGYIKVAFLGVVQGISELLPISSTAHMRIVPALLGWQDPGSAFSAAMQLAALAAVISYFWRDLVELVGGAGSAVFGGRLGDRHLRMLIWILVGTLPIVVGGVLLSKVLNACNSPLRSVSVIGWACVAMAVLLGLSEIFAKHKRDTSDVKWYDAVFVGIAQVGALIPGVSRSGSTLTAALALGFKREEAARFSFLLGLPAIALAGGKELVELHSIHLSLEGWKILAVGLGVASVSAFVAIWGLMRILEKFSSWPFVIYRALLGVALLVGAAKGLIA